LSSRLFVRCPEFEVREMTNCRIDELGNCLNKGSGFDASTCFDGLNKGVMGSGQPARGRVRS